MSGRRRPWAPFGLRPRVARQASPAWNVAKTLLQVAGMWTTFYVLLPAAVYEVESRTMVAQLRLDPAPWRAPAVAVFAACGVLGIWCGVLLAVGGAGTPLPFDTARALVVSGPYRHVRNPMAMLSLTQGAAIAAWLGSPGVAAYVAAGAAVWNWIARPWEEADLLVRFGDRYAHYRDHVPCWRLRLRGYVPGE